MATRGSLPSVISFVALFAATGCAVATGEVKGGDDAPPPTTASGDGPVAVTGSTSDGGTAEAAEPPAADPCADAGNRGSGSTFADLYRDFFGPTGAASCGSRSVCHVENGEGMLTSGFMCASDSKTCWMSMTSTIVPVGGSPAPEMTALYAALRKAPPATTSGPMPRNSSFAFCPDDLARIKTWISNGAQTPQD